MSETRDPNRLAEQALKARRVVESWPLWKQQALERQINSKRASDLADYRDWCVQEADGEQPQMSFEDWLRERARIRAESGVAGSEEGYPLV